MSGVGSEQRQNRDFIDALREVLGMRALYDEGTSVPSDERPLAFDTMSDEYFDGMVCSTMIHQNDRRAFNIPLTPSERNRRSILLNKHKEVYRITAAPAARKDVSRKYAR